MSRLLAKALSYRAASLLVMVAIGATLMGSVTAGLSVGLVDSVFKLAIYYYHEKLWDRFSPSTAVA